MFMEIPQRGKSNSKGQRPLQNGNKLFSPEWAIAMSSNLPEIQVID
jgi:hypothetical protein